MARVKECIHIQYSYAPHNDVSVNDGPHMRRWSHKIIIQYYNTVVSKSLTVYRTVTRGSVRSTRGLGPTMTARGQSIGISIGMLPQTLIMSRLDQLSRLGARI